MRTSSSLALLWCVFLTLGTAALAAAQTISVTPAPVDAAAVTAMQKAMAALAGPASITDVTLVGTATRTVGSETESGSITLKAFGTKFSAIQFNSSQGSLTETRGFNAQGLPAANWSGPDGNVHKAAGQNVVTDAVWFFPALSKLSLNTATSPSIAISYVGLEERNGSQVQHLHFMIQHHSPVAAPTSAKIAVKRAAPPPQIEHLSGMDFYLDATTNLPTETAFNTHPDNNSATDIPVDVQFSNYQTVNGWVVPLHIQQSINGTPLYDITVQSVTVNSGLSAADFAVQ